MPLGVWLEAPDNALLPLVEEILEPIVGMGCFNGLLRQIWVGVGFWWPVCSSRNPDFSEIGL